MRFVKFTEHNDHEGESWHFWLQLDGNEAAVSVLADAVATEENYPYHLDLTDPEPESAVDVLVKHADAGYMDNHHKMVGALTVPADFDVDSLYKGGVRDLFTAPGSGSS